MRKLLTLLLGGLLIVTHLQAQTRIVTGKITDESGIPIPNASIQVKGAKTGTTTGTDGNFSLTVSNTATKLIISAVNYTDQEIQITEGLLAIQLKASNASLSEVVVVGYGTVKKRELTGAVAKLADSTLTNIPLQGPDQALRGRVAGVTVMQSSGTPGSSMSVNIRGTSSISGSSQPLYVIDGVIINTGSFSQIGAGGQTLNSLSEINPDDIESMEVLKDAAAAAIYGSRGANGVVLITTKRGANQKTAINVTAYTGTQSAWKKMDALTGPQYVQLVQEAIVNRYGSTYKPSTLGFSGLDNDPSTYPTSTWQDSIFRKAPISNIEMSFRGGSDKTKFFLSGGYFDQKGTLIGSEYKRYSIRLNLDNQVSSGFKIATNIALSRSINSRINNDNNIYGVLSSAILLAPYFLGYNADGTYARDPNNGTVENPMASAYERYNRVKTNRVLASVSGEYQFLPSLSLKTQVSADYIDLNEASFLPSTTLEGAAGPNGVGKEGYAKVLNLLGENIVTFKPKLYGGHHLVMTGVASYQESKSESMYGSASNYPGNGIQRLSAASQITSLTSTGTSFGIIGYLVRANYDFKSKYLLSASIRRDGSSRLGALNRWGTFPAISAAWRVSDEDFMKSNSISKIVSDLKIRGSYGSLGSSELGGDFLSRSLVAGGSNYLSTPGLYPYQLGNDSLQWEQAKQADLGIDAAFLNNRILLTVDFYKKTTADLLSSKTLVGSSGFTSVTTNIGKVENKGIEISLNTENIRTKDFRWSTAFNISFNKNTIKELSSAAYATGFGSWVQAGESLGSFRGYKRLGIFQSDAEVAASPTQTSSTKAGDIKFADLTGDGAVTSADQTILGTASPAFTGGFTNTFSYKGFELMAFFQFVQGNKVLNYTKIYAEGMNTIYGQFASALNRWTTSKTNTDVPRAVYGDPNSNRRVSDRFVEDASYIRLKNVILSYSIPRSIINRLKLSNVKVYVQSQNLVTWTKYSGFDPEVNYAGVSNTSTTNTAQGTDFLTYPQARSFTFGINLGL